MKNIPNTKLMLKIVYVTIVALVISFVVLLSAVIAQFVSSDSDEGDENIETGTGTVNIKGYSIIDPSDDQLYTGDLLQVDSSHPLNGTSGNKLSLIAEATSRPKKSDGKNVYTIFGTTSLSGTQESIDALNKMIGDYFNIQSGGTDDNLIIANAASISGSNNGAFATGLVYELEYYEYYNSSSDNKRASIFGVQKYEWIYSNAYKYGFVRLYPTDNSADTANLFRYVGVAHATQMNNTGATLTEYIDLLKGKTHTSPLTIKGADENTYYVYYTPKGSDLYVPDNYEYTVSGDNVGGYIVTVNRTAGNKQ